MSTKENKKKLVGPWRTFHGVIWLVGLYLLFSSDFFFPGILILLAVSAVYEGLLAKFAPHAFEVETARTPVVEAASIGVPAPGMTDTSGSSPAIQEHRLELLPQACPSCSGPIRGHEVKWTGPQSANCPYCGTNLPMNRT